LGHNFTRGWFWEDGYYSPLPYVEEQDSYRLSPPYSERYLKRLRQRVRAAHRRGLFVSVMLFQGWSMDDRGGFRDPDPWPVSPYNSDNTDERVTKQNAALHIGLAQSQQLEYLSFVARKLCKEPNIIWEIVNEAHPGSLGTDNASNWQRNILEGLRSECKRRLTWVSCPLQTMVSPSDRQRMTEILMGMDSDIVTPCRPTPESVENPKMADGRKVIIADTDHFTPDDVTPEWVWKAFLRGQHPIFMDLSERLTWWNGDPWDPDDIRWAQVHRALGAVQDLVAAIEKPRAGAPVSGLAALAPQARAGGRPNNRTRPADSKWALYSSSTPCPNRKAGGCGKARANGDELVVFADPGETVRVCRLEAGSVYRYRWKKTVRPGFLASASKNRASASGCLKLRNPGERAAILHLERETG
jgi:hypothetical protein